MPDWLIERGIGESRAVRIEEGQEAQAQWGELPDRPVLHPPLVEQLQRVLPAAAVDGGAERPEGEVEGVVEAPAGQFGVLDGAKEERPAPRRHVVDCSPQ